MNVNEVLQFVDKLVVEKTGRHLDDVQKAVVEGTWQRQTYDDIAQKCHVTEGHAGDVASELWQLLSQIAGEDIKKSNFRSTLERIYIKSSQNPNICGNNNFILQTINHPEQQTQESKINNKYKSDHQDLTLAPQIARFYNRESELDILTNWILSQNIRLISVLGLSGIGKTYLVKRFVELDLEGFEVIIWNSFQYPQSLNLLIKDFLNICKQKHKETTPAKLKQLFEIMAERKCLLILDDVQNIFISGELAGQYKPEYKDYQKFFRMITETNHQSNVILISQEQCVEMHCLDDELYPIKCLSLSGLDDVDILKNTGLTDEENWLNLIKLYEGNPLYLKSVANSIKNIFDGNVTEFLSENELIITKDMQNNLQSLFNKLSPTEQQIVLKLSNFEQPISREDLKATLDLSSTDFINGLASLQQRYLVTKIKEEKFLFKLSPVFREYVRNCRKD